MKNALIQAIETNQLKQDVPSFKTGDIIKVQFKIIEGKRERLQAFEGVVLKTRGRGASATATVRKIVSGVGVEKTFYLHAPVVAAIEVIKYSKVRRARLFYLRDLLGSKQTRVKEHVDKNIAAASAKSKLKKEEAKVREAEKLKSKEEASKKKAEEEKAAKEAKAKEKAEKTKAVVEKPKEEPKGEKEPKKEEIKVEEQKTEEQKTEEQK